MLSIEEDLVVAEMLADIAHKEIKRCRKNKVHFISNYIYIRNPKNASKGLPTKFLFNLYPEQCKLVAKWDELVRSVEGGSRLLEKSREEGATFLILAYTLHEFIFKPHSVTTLGSRIVTLVDKSNDPDTLFEKFRGMIADLPDFLRPDIDDRNLRIKNNENGAVVKGEGGDNMGRGGRSGLFFVDEWDFVEHPQKVFNAINENAHAKVFVSTVAGTGTYMHQQGQAGMPLDRLMWHDNPTKNHYYVENGKKIYPWYEQKKIEYAADPIGLATEIDADRSSAVRGVLIPYVWVQAAFDYVMPAEGISRSGVDVSADTGGDLMPYANLKGGVVRRLDRLSGDNLEQDVRDNLYRDSAERLCYDRNGVGFYSLKGLSKNPIRGLTVTGIANNEKPSKSVLWDRPTTEDNEGKSIPYTADMRFFNVASELGWRLRLMFLATYEKVTGTNNHDDDKCISLHLLNNHPSKNDIMTQLSQPTFERRGNKELTYINKFGLGTNSPDYYEALMYALFQPPEPTPIRVRRLM